MEEWKTSPSRRAVLIKFYCEDVLTAMQKIPSSWDLVISDGPSLDDMPPGEAIKRLQVAHSLADDSATLFYYGVNIDNCIRLVNRSGWDIRNTFSLWTNTHNGDFHIGCVVQAGKHARIRRSHQKWLDKLPSNIWVEPKGVRTQKSEDWFVPFISMGKYNHCLDMYCGFGGAARACNIVGIECSAVEIDKHRCEHAARSIGMSGISSY